MILVVSVHKSLKFSVCGNLNSTGLICIERVRGDTHKHKIVIRRWLDEFGEGYRRKSILNHLGKPELICAECQRRKIC